MNEKKTVTSLSRPSCQTNLIFFIHRVTGLMDKRAVDENFLNFFKVFGTIPSDIFMNKQKRKMSRCNHNQVSIKLVEKLLSKNYLSFAVELGGHLK